MSVKRRLALHPLGLSRGKRREKRGGALAIRTTNRRTGDAQNKSPAKWAGLSFDATQLTQRHPGRISPLKTETGLLGRSSLADVGFERLVGLLGEIGIKLAELGRLGDEAFIGGLGVVGLDLDRLVERLGADELLDDGCIRFESLLRIIGRLSRDRLDVLRRRAEALETSTGILQDDASPAIF